MTRTEVKNILINKFIEDYDEEYPVLYDNDSYPFDKPFNTPWIRFVIQNDKSTQRSFGVAPARKFNRGGIISFQVFIPANTGTYVGDNLCDDICNIFEGKRISNVICKTAFWKEIGLTESDWYQYDGTVFFDFDEEK